MKYSRMLLLDELDMGSQRGAINRALLTTCLWGVLPDRFTREKSAR